MIHAFPAGFRSSPPVCFGYLRNTDHFLTHKKMTMALSIPAFSVSDISKVSGSGSVFIQSRQDAVRAGVFVVTIDVHFDPAVDLYPTGTVIIRSDLSESLLGSFVATSVDQINSYGRQTPTVFLTGRCTDDIQPTVKGCRYWLMIANNKKNPAQTGIPDVVSFAVHDNKGNLIAYGTGPIRSGDFDVMAK